MVKWLSIALSECVVSPQREIIHIPQTFASDNYMVMYCLIYVWGKYLYLGKGNIWRMDDSSRELKGLRRQRECLFSETNKENVFVD